VDWVSFLQTASEPDAPAADNAHDSGALREHAAICTTSAEHAEDEMAYLQKLKDAVLVCLARLNTGNSFLVLWKCCISAVFAIAGCAHDEPRSCFAALLGLIVCI
jgi:hypothetical protein